ncbi:MAG TPA: N-acetylmuramoyl-L-alanine amidase, partial [Candidatus Binataceae bacterium]|nr:N-acetylmuramoyl-L-alanine amidase [Candidatus Binataceae bacterium]
VFAIDTAGTRAQIVIDVTGRTDYSVATLPHELVVRLARSEAGADEPPRAPTGGPGSALPDSAGIAPPQARLSPPKLDARSSMTAPPVASPSRGAAPVVAPPPRPMMAAAAIIAAPPSSAATAAAPSAASPLVVIDPGHGGFDAGTEVASPILEKDLALQISLRLALNLKRRGARVMLTRTGDYFLTLAQRTALANNAGADLFISIHLNSSSNSEDSGIETYYLNNTTDRATIRLARMENGGQPAYGASASPDLNFILSDMRQQYKANEAVALAAMIEQSTALDLDRSFGLNVRAPGARRGPFYVLVGARMPAVLVECGFLSNPAEAARLASPAYQDVLAAGIAEAVTHYFSAGAAVGNL